MSNDMTTLDNTALPAHLQRATELAAAFNTGLRQGITQGFARISIRGSRWRIKKGGEEDVLDSLTLDVVVIGANPHVSKLYYIKAYNPDDSDDQPDCVSQDGITPEPSSPAKQCESCAACPQNVWGSKITPQGTETKACADLKRIAVVGYGDLTGSIYALTIPAASLKGLANYIDKLDKRGVSALGVKTVLSFDPDAAFPKIEFKADGYLSEAEFETVLEQANDPEVKVVTGQTAAPAQSSPAQTAGDDTQKTAETKPEATPAKKSTGKKVSKKKASKKAQAAAEAEGTASASTASAFGSTSATKTAEEQEPAEEATSGIADDLDDVLGDLNFEDD